MGKTKQKTKPAEPVSTAPKKPRELIKRQIPLVSGAGHIVVVKSGEDLRASLTPRYEAMARDLEKFEFYWDRIVTDSTYHETREFPDHNRMAKRWMALETVNTPQQYRARMKKLKTWLDYFKPGSDYELSVDEVVEIVA